MKQYHGTYIGPIKELQGERAILQVEEHYVQDMVPAHGQVMARTCYVQFDNLLLPQSHGWHYMPITHFKLEYRYEQEAA